MRFDLLPHHSSKVIRKVLHLILLFITLVLVSNVVMPEYNGLDKESIELSENSENENEENRDSKEEIEIDDFMTQFISFALMHTQKVLSHLNCNNHTSISHPDIPTLPPEQV